MSTENRRKKNPELVKQSLIECAATLAATEGISNVSIQKVADMAGVTKGGLLHHFPSRRHLLDALYDHLLMEIENDINARMVGDQEYGCFTRAYISGMLDDLKEKPKPAQATLSMLLDAELCKVWEKWLAAKLEMHKTTDGDAWLEMLRYSADGVWLMASCGTVPDLEAITDRLIIASKKEVKL